MCPLEQARQERVRLYWLSYARLRIDRFRGGRPRRGGPLLRHAGKLKLASRACLTGFGREASRLGHFGNQSTRRVVVAANALPERKDAASDNEAARRHPGVGA